MLKYFITSSVYHTCVNSSFCHHNHPFVTTNDYTFSCLGSGPPDQQLWKYVPNFNFTTPQSSLTLFHLAYPPPYSSIQLHTVPIHSHTAPSSSMPPSPIPSRSTQPHPDPLSPIQIHSAPSRSTQPHPDPLSPIQIHSAPSRSTQPHPDPLSPIQIHSAPSRSTQPHPDPLSPIQIHSAPSRSTQPHPDPLSPIHPYSDPSDSIQIHSIPPIFNL